jgi:alpha-tubulin suppressor-like RCC1 family protein
LYHIGFSYSANDLTINKDLSDKQIIDLKNGWNHVIEHTIDGKFYNWGRNGEESFKLRRVLGNGKNDKKIYKPEIFNLK